MKSGYTDIIMLLDRSGSMQTIARDTMGGYNSFIQKQKEATGEATITLIQFDGNEPYQVTQNNVDIKEAIELTPMNFIPRGNTPLLDSIGITITKIGEKYSAMKEEDRPEKVIFVIITDGEENASTEYKKPQINDMITKQTKEFSWEFVFLAANQDAISVGTSYGISGLNSLTYTASSAGVNAVFGSLADNMLSTRSVKGATMAYSTEQRAEAMAH